MLSLQPDQDIILEFIKQEEYKYVRILGAFYFRLIGKALDIYNYLEPLYQDYRKIVYRQADGKYIITHVDEIIDHLLQDDYYFDIALPRIPKRRALEEQGKLEARRSALEDL